MDVTENRIGRVIYRRDSEISYVVIGKREREEPKRTR